MASFGIGGLAAARAVSILLATCGLGAPLDVRKPRSDGHRRCWKREVRRRSLFGSVAASAALLLPGRARAARVKGAAELDLEYYVRDALLGNPQQGSVDASVFVRDPPRSLGGPLLPLLLDDACDERCVPVQELANRVRKTNQGASEAQIVRDIQARVHDLREKSKRSFSSRQPWDTERVTDQYFFDLTAYALWRTAALLLPVFSERDLFVRDIGRTIYRKVRESDLLSERHPSTVDRDRRLTTSLPHIMQALELFKSTGFCKGYRVAGDTQMAPAPANKSKSKQAPPPPPPLPFDDLDDETIASGGSVDVIVSVYDPATLGASLQITGEQSRFAPDYVGATLAAIWEDSFGIGAKWEVFFVDPEYRPNPKDYFPNEQLLQFTLQLR